MFFHLQKVTLDTFVIHSNNETFCKDVLLSLENLDTRERFVEALLRVNEF